MQIQFGNIRVYIRLQPSPQPTMSQSFHIEVAQPDPDVKHSHQHIGFIAGRLKFGVTEAVDRLQLSVSVVLDDMHLDTQAENEHFDRILLVAAAVFQKQELIRRIYELTPGRFYSPHAAVFSHIDFGPVLNINDAFWNELPENAVVVARDDAGTTMVDPLFLQELLVQAEELYGPLRIYTNFD